MTYPLNRTLFNSPNQTTDLAINAFFADQSPIAQAIEALPKKQIPNSQTHKTAAQSPLKGPATNSLLSSVSLSIINYPNGDKDQGEFQTTQGRTILAKGISFFNVSKTTLEGTMGWFTPVQAMILLCGKRERAGNTETRSFEIRAENPSRLYGKRICLNKNKEFGTFFYDSKKDEIALWEGRRIRDTDKAEIIVGNGCETGTTQSF